jgi:GDPmannose 4,6-dehydratase
MMAKYILTGVTGQDGSYMSELLLEKGHEVYGIVRRSSSINTGRVDHLRFEKGFNLIFGDLADGIDTLIYDIRPDVIINLAAMSHVRVSYDVPVYTLDINAIGPARLLEAIRKIDRNIRYYQASSSEMFGTSSPPQNENTPFQPCSPYGCAKLAAYWITKTYRDGYGIFASNGILFNHESPRRGETFVTKKIVRGAVRIKLGKQKNIILGNLEAKRDWGHSKDYVEAIYKIINHDIPDDFIVATGEHYSIKEFLVKVFESLNMDWHDYIKFDERYTRPKEVPSLLGNPTKIKKVLGWEPTIKIEQLISEMIAHAMEGEK